ncbi:MAG: hypothetical protein M1839_004492 [Geoglossum umbratile]|nr:MAG: hypothetical protein M1839_004492 [Geoglossum umbratile]
MKLLSAALAGAALAAVVTAQSLADALNKHSQFSNFTDLLRSHPDLASGLVPATTADRRTILVPNNDAFGKLTISIGSLPTAQIRDMLNYHSLVGEMTAADFSAPSGLTVPTFLTSAQYNNRSSGDRLNSIGASTASHSGQVVVITVRANSKREFSVRQQSSTADVTSGLANKVTLTALDDNWEGGKIQMIDGFLTLPLVCTETIRARDLTSLDASLNRTSLSSALDHSNNVTCLGPSNDAFLQAGSPDKNLAVADLSKALLFHTLSEPVYTSFLKDGQTFQTLTNDTVAVSIKNGSIYFNNARLVEPNVITNNGLIHILDSVMMPLSSQTPSPTQSGSSPTKSGSAQTSKAAAPSLAIPSKTWNILELFGFVVAILLW